MTRKLICQKCNQDTSVELCFDDEIDSQAFNCVHGGSRHVEVDWKIAGFRCLEQVPFR